MKIKTTFCDCYIEGTTDFIFGPATAVFQNCTIRAKQILISLLQVQLKEKHFGYVFIDCKIIADSAVNKLYLGKTMAGKCQNSFYSLRFPKAIAPEGWNNWSNPENEKTVFYAEYKNTGEGAASDKRVKWSKQLNDKASTKLFSRNYFFFFSKRRRSKWCMVFR